VRGELGGRVSGGFRPPVTGSSLSARLEQTPSREADADAHAPGSRRRGRSTQTGDRAGRVGETRGRRSRRGRREGAEGRKWTGNVEEEDWWARR